MAARAGKDLRLSIAWRLLFVAYLGLAAVSLAIFRRGIDLHTADGRHLLAGGLANLGLIWAGLFITAKAYRAGKRWAWFANLACLYGIPLMFVDARIFGWFSQTLVPQIVGAVLALIGLALPLDVFFGRKSE